MRSFIVAFILLVFFASCRTQRTAPVNYLQTTDTTGIRRMSFPEPVIQKNDLLSIRVYSLSTDPAIDAIYNLPEVATAGTMPAASGFLVDDGGNIDYPKLGILHVEGLTKTQLAGIIKSRLENVLKSPSVIVRFLNYRVTVLGEVRTPGTFTVPSERVTVLEALGLAGDITEYGNKYIVRIAREKNNEVVIGQIDLTSKTLFSSPFFRLQQNDVVLVEQNRRRVEIEENQYTLQRVSIITSIITTLAITFNVLRR